MKTILFLSALVLTALIFNSCQGGKSGVRIGKQIWMAQNLSIENFRNGDTIPQAKTKQDWNDAKYDKLPAWCYFPNEDSSLCGKLYNWYAINDKRGFAPDGWHIPTTKEWDELNGFLISEGYGGFEAEKLKSDTLWKSKINKSMRNGNGDNLYGFNCVPCGARNRRYFFGRDNAYYWTSSVPRSRIEEAIVRKISYRNHTIGYHDDGDFEDGYSVRCIKD